MRFRHKLSDRGVAGRVAVDATEMRLCEIVVVDERKKEKESSSYVVVGHVG